MSNQFKKIRRIYWGKNTSRNKSVSRQHRNNHVKLYGCQQPRFSSVYTVVLVSAAVHILIGFAVLLLAKNVNVKLLLVHIENGLDIAMVELLKSFVTWNTVLEVQRNMCIFHKIQGMDSKRVRHHLCLLSTNITYELNYNWS